MATQQILLNELANQTGNITTNVTANIPQGANIFDLITGLGFGGIAGFFLILPICYSLVGRDAYRDRFFLSFYFIFSGVFSAAFNYYSRKATPIDSIMFLLLGVTIAIFIYLIKKEI